MTARDSLLSASCVYMTCRERTVCCMRCICNMWRAHGLLHVLQASLGESVEVMNSQRWPVCVNPQSKVLTVQCFACVPQARLTG